MIIITWIIMDERCLALELEQARNLPTEITMDNLYIRTEICNTDTPIKCEGAVGKFYICCTNIAQDETDITVYIYIGGTIVGSCYMCSLFSKILYDRDVIYENDQIKVPVYWFDCFPNGMFPLHLLTYHDLHIGCRASPCTVQYNVYHPSATAPSKGLLFYQHIHSFYFGIGQKVVDNSIVYAVQYLSQCMPDQDDLVYHDDNGNLFIYSTEFSNLGEIQSYTSNIRPASNSIKIIKNAWHAYMFITKQWSIEHGMFITQ